MDSFWIYIKIGLEHILDFNGADHMLFVISLCTLFPLHKIRQLTILVTAFTLGHSISLALSVFSIVQISSYWVELFIPLSILLTSSFNLWKKESPQTVFIYWIPLLFGLVHGLGFSNYLSALLGSESSVGSALFAFNLGLEIGQLLIVVGFLGIRETYLYFYPENSGLLFKVTNVLIILGSIFFIFDAI
ncbi:MAG: HupE/UreJ family protein [Flavobacteriales bacterium]|nr:HupE/UreJ family protein [Flavobacteriales bacterium]